MPSARSKTSKHQQQPIGTAFLGVISDNISKQKAEALGFDNPYGSYVSEIVPGTAAEQADFKPFDYIVGMIIIEWVLSRAYQIS